MLDPRPPAAGKTPILDIVWKLFWLMGLVDPTGVGVFIKDGRRVEVLRNRS